MNTEKPYYSYAIHFKKRYGKRYLKIPLNAGLTCPNRDGTLGTGGCIYCNNEAFSPPYCSTGEDLITQLKKGIAFYHQKFNNETFNIAYLQTFTNTYTSLKQFKAIVAQVLSNKDIHGIAISTRPDCLSDQMMDYLSYLSENLYVELEIGIESCYNTTLMKMRRGHDFETTVRTLQKLHDRKILICGHLVAGFPGETPEMIVEEAQIISKLPVNILKIHQLQILKNTALAGWFDKSPQDFHIFTKDEYIDLIIRFLERLSPSVFIERLCAEVPPRYLHICPWEQTPAEKISSEIEKRMKEQKTYQGKYFQ